MKQVEYFIALPEDNRIRVRFKCDKSAIIGFATQLEIKSRVKKKYAPVVRYDTAHGFTHKDELKPDGTQIKTPVYFTSNKAALEWVINDLKENWQFYFNRYKAWEAKYEKK